ncbi:ECF RNA polymerase sigma factor SigE [Planctomycetales bacterium 10988]|nr:ECF RNA polymerase sigma factor SigE [Planctomycetales bacterium 10988]
MTKTSESETYLAMRAGDSQACEAFVREQYEGLHRWFWSMTRCPERAADLCQETFMGFWQSLNRTIPKAPPHVWLYAIGRNLWRKDCRKRHRRYGIDREIPIEEIHDHQPAPTRHVEERELTEVLEEEVAELPADYREALTLRVWQEFGYEEIAEIQGITKDLARWRCFRARQLVQTRLKSRNVTEEDYGT